MTMRRRPVPPSSEPVAPSRPTDEDAIAAGASPGGAAVPTRRGTGLRVATAVTGAALLLVAVVSTAAAGHQAALDDLDHALTAEASSEAGALAEYFDRARSLNLLLSHDTAFRQFAPGALPESGPSVTSASAEAGAAMAYLEELYPGRISEACLIDSTGTEIARVVRGQVAPAHELSTEEAEAPFFLPTMRAAEGEVHQAAPYLSPDTDQWVISNSTPMIAAPATEPWGLVHFEVTLDSFRPAATPDGMTAILVDVRSGEVLLEDGVELGVRAPGRPASADLRALVAATTVTGSATVGEDRVAVTRVATGPGNVNEWAVVVTAPIDTVGWTRSVGPAPVAMGLAAVLLLTFAGLNLRSSHRRLTHVGLHDELTGLPNRRLLNDRLGQALALNRRRRGTCAVLVIDLDRFKEVNDTLGHQFGDALLRAAADRLGGAVRESDTVARLGGDEFAVLLPEVTDGEAALVLARRCLQALHQTFTLNGLDLDIEASVGVAVGPDHGGDSTELLRVADVAMYESKSQARGVVLYQPALDVHTPHRLALLGDLRRALHNDELTLHYQPKVAVGTQDVSGVEALVRWHHPVRGMVPPDDFIPVAEGTGLIMPLTLRTLELAIAQARAWCDLGNPIQVAVNLSPRCLLEVAFPGMVAEMLERHALPGAPAARRADRDHDHGRSRARAGGADPTQGAGSLTVHRRLRHRVLVDVLSQAAPGGRAQDRPVLRHGHARRPRGRRPGALFHRPRPQPRDVRRGRGCRGCGHAHGPVGARVRRGAGLPPWPAHDR